ncbi:MAG TPA: hypothetical protein VHF22_14930 [Planctomycetota bacterium]|nr:hypothetical protein [Planctomycetota bacterium]
MRGGRRRATLESVKNVFWALLFAVALWLVMAQSEQTTREVDVTLNVAPPTGANVNYMTRLNQPPAARVMVRGPRTILERLNEGPYEAIYKVPESTDLGLKTYAVKDFEFHLPPGVEVERTGLQPPEIKVELAQRQVDELAVEANLVRDLPEGWEIESESLEPSSLRASGSIEEMARNPKLTTTQVSLRKLLERADFDPHIDTPKTFEQKVQAQAPEGSGINILDSHPLTLRVKVRPKPKEKEIDIAPAYHFAGPVFPGLPYKLRPQIPAKDKVHMRVGGPEFMLMDAQIEATKALFVVYVEIRPDDIPKGKLELGTTYTFNVHVIPPSGIKVLSNDEKFRVVVDPMDDSTVGGK